MPLASLLALATVSRYRAQDFYRRRQYAQYGATGLACVGVFLPTTYAWVAAAIAFGLQAYAVFLRISAKQIHELSRDAQRRALLEDTLGCRIESFDVTDLYSRAGKSLAESANKKEMPDRYYNNDHPHGIDRLRTALQESTFWSEQLLKKAAAHLGYKIAVTALGIIVPAFVLFVIGTPLNYTIALAFLTVLAVLADDIESCLSCMSASKRLYELDARLQRVDDKAVETILAAFADYSVATAVAPPIPSGIYEKAKPHLAELWQARQMKGTPLGLETVSQRVGTPINIEIELNERTLPVWLGAMLVRQAIRTITTRVCPSGTTDIRASLRPLLGFSGTPVFNLDIVSGKRLIFKLVLRFHRSRDEAAREIELVKKISSTGIDAVCYTVLEDALTESGIVVYYHAQHQTQEDVSTLQTFLRGAVLQSDQQLVSAFAEKKLYSGFASVATVYETLTTEYIGRPISELLSKYKKDWLPDFIIDGRKEAAKVQNGLLLIRYLNSYPDSIEEIPQFEHPSEIKTDQSGWVSIKVEFESASEYGSAGAMLTLKGSEWEVRVLVTRETFETIVSQLDKVMGIVSHAQNSPESHSSYLARECKLRLPPDDKMGKAWSLLENSQDFGAMMAFRHRDLHTRNILVSSSSFKLIDVGDSGRDLAFCDLARLEIAILSCLGECMPLTNDDMVNIIRACEAKRHDAQPSSNLSERLSAVANLVTEVRQCFEKKFKWQISEVERCFAYFNELQIQLNHSLISTQRLSSCCGVLVSFWTERLTKQLSR
jgi:hypothetical protein